MKTGAKHTPEARAKISAAGVGRVPWNKGGVGPNKGRKFSPEWRAKLSAAKKDYIPWNKGTHGKMAVPWNLGLRGYNSGEKHPQWKGGRVSEMKMLRNSFEYKLWRDAVFKRDNYTCIWCGVHGTVLNADHIKPFAYFPELRLAIDNGRTLCVPCHRTTETYGNKQKNHG